MKIRTENEVKEFNAALDKCTSPVWLMGPDDESYNMKTSDGYVKGMAKLLESNADQFGIFTGSYEDEQVMMNLFNRMAGAAA